MKPEPFTDALVRLLHCYYPSGLRNGDPRYGESEEAQRLTRLILAVQPSPTWKGFMQRVVEEFPGCGLWDTTVPYYEPCTSIRVYFPGTMPDAPRTTALSA